MSKRDLYIKAKAPCLYNTLPTKSGQTVSYATGDDGDDQRAREVSFFILTNNNPFGNNTRFTGITGGYHQRSSNTFRDKDGVVTTKALAFPDNLMLDWAYYKGNENFGEVMMWYYDNALLQPSTLRSWNGLLSYINTLSYTGFTNWKMPNQLELSLVLFWGNNTIEFLNFEPFNVVNHLIWLNQTDPTNTAQAYRFGQSSFLFRVAMKNFEGAAVRLMCVRYSNYTVTGTGVIIS